MRTQKTPHLSRRRFVKASLATALTSSASLNVWGSSPNEPYAGKLLVTLQLDGGADVTQLCDPKTNTLGEPKINHWADWADPGQEGNLLYAPIADNAGMFRRFGADTLVVNGIDAQTNSHETGRLFNWTGSNAEGRPSLTALHAAANSPDQPLAYSVFGGGTSRTSGLITYNRFDDVGRLRELTLPDRNWWDSESFARPQMELVRAQEITRRSITQMLTNPSLTPRQRKHLVNHQSALDGRDSLARLASSLPSNDELEEGAEFTVGDFGFWSNLKQQMQGALLVMQSGLGSAADIVLGGFDSHNEHDAIHEALYTHLADALYFFWNYAEELGIADRILLVIGSDFGRTNFYNDGNGKDHWNVGSYMLMEQNASWGNRVVGASDELHFALPIDPDSLQPDRNGIILTPAHVHRAVRSYLGLDGFAQSVGLNLTGVEDIGLFDPSKMTHI